MTTYSHSAVIVMIEKPRSMWQDGGADGGLTGGGRNLGGEAAEPPSTLCAQKREF